MTAKFETLIDLIERLADHGDRPALITLTKQEVRRQSFGELSERVEALARGLRAAGIRDGARVALLADNSPQWLAVALAALRAGGVTMPLDGQMEQDNLKTVLQDGAPSLLFTGETGAKRVGELDLESGPEVIRLDREEGDDSWRRFLDREGGGEPPAIGPDDDAVLFYTSGTTGPPKGVPLKHRNLVFQLNTIRDSGILDGSDRVLMPLPLHHVYPFALGLMVPLGMGLPLVFPHARTGPQIVRAIGEGKATVVLGVPRLYSALFQGIQSRAESAGRVGALMFRVLLPTSRFLRQRLNLHLGKRLFAPLHKRFGPSLRMLISGGSPLDPELAWKLESLGWRVAAGYGLTETSPLITINPPGTARFDTVGEVIDGVEVRIDTHRKQAEEGAEWGEGQGEILVKGPNVFDGYRNMPDKTEESFSDEWYRTGDLGSLDQGWLSVHGRVSTMIITESGEKVQPDEVEEAYQQHPSIKEVGVLQNDDRQLVAVIIPSPEAAHEKNGVEGAMRLAVNEAGKRLASFQRIGDYVIGREPLPRTRLGKVRRHKLTERYRQLKAGGGEPARQGPISEEEMAPEDRTLLEDSAARQVWEMLTERFADRDLTPDASPQLDLGMDSLAWLNLTLEIRNRVGVELDEEAIGRIETVRDLLQEVAEAGEAGEQVGEFLDHPEESLSDKQRRYLAPISGWRAGLARLLYRLNRRLIKGLFGIKVEGLHNLPKEGFVLTPNHLSVLDPFALAAALDDDHLSRTHWAGWTGMAFGNPLFAAVSRLAQAVPIEPERAVMSSLAFGAAVLKRKRCLIWFPEGERARQGKLLPFRPGIGMLLERYPVPVVPVAIIGTYEAMAPGRKWPKFVRLTVRFGRPQDPRKLQRRAREEEHGYEVITRGLRREVARLGAPGGEERN